MSKILINKDVKVFTMHSDYIKDMYNKMLCDAVDEYERAEKECINIYNNEYKLLKAKFSEFMDVYWGEQKGRNKCSFKNKKEEIIDKIMIIVDFCSIDTINELIEYNKDNDEVIKQIDKWLCWKRCKDLREMMNRIGILK